MDHFLKLLLSLWLMLSPNADIPEIVHHYSELNGVKPEVVAAIIFQESKGNPIAYKPEKGFTHLYLDPKTKEELGGFWPSPVPDEEGERWARGASWGLMQIMGQTARETGLKSQYLTALMIPDINIAIGTTYFKRLLNKQKGFPPDEAYFRALTAYNAGNPNSERGKKYAATILDHIAKKRYFPFFIRA